MNIRYTNAMATRPKVDGPRIPASTNVMTVEMTYWPPNMT